MKTLPLNALRAFSCVYECGGVRPAARQLEVTHSSVSRHLRELEAWIGVELLDKASQRRLSFTPAGEALGKASLKSLQDLDAVVMGIREQRRGNAITIETTPSFAARWLLPRLPALEAALPWIEISIIVDQKLSEAGSSTADFAIRMGRGPWPGLACEAFMDDRLFPVVGRSLWEKHGKAISQGNLNGVRIIHDRDPSTAWQVWQKQHRLEKLNLRAGPRFTSSDLVLRAASQNQGIALARGRFAQDDVAAGALVRPFGEEFVALPDAYWIVRDPKLPERVAVAAVVAWLKEEAAPVVPSQ